MLQQYPVLEHLMPAFDLALCLRMIGRSAHMAQALVDGSHYILQVSPARAANLLGLTTQVPAKLVYFTDGPTCTRHVTGTDLAAYCVKERHICTDTAPVGGNATLLAGAV